MMLFGFALGWSALPSALGRAEEVERRESAETSATVIFGCIMKDFWFECAVEKVILSYSKDNGTIILIPFLLPLFMVYSPLHCNLAEAEVE